MTIAQEALDKSYYELSEPEMFDRIGRHKEHFGSRLVILGHHYQADQVIQFADFAGDSLKLARVAAQQKQAEFVVFCGVHFMAESADILTDRHVKVILPHLVAGCTLADMAGIEQVERCWQFLSQATGERIVPVTYINSSAAIKAFCGRKGGACCTSSNAANVLEWALSGGQKVLFLPDQHLARNTAYAMGFPLEAMALYKRSRADGGLTAEQVRRAKFVLWNGDCCVHQVFTTEQCRHLRQLDGQFKIIVHPECPWQVVQQADLSGGTEFIIRTIEQSPTGSKWAVGTETNLVNRLAKRYGPDKQVRNLAEDDSLCQTMALIDPPHLLWVLDELAAGRVVNQITVDPATAGDARLSLERMLANVPSAAAPG